jgi:hypothetical protein
MHRNLIEYTSVSFLFVFYTIVYDCKPISHRDFAVKRQCDTITEISWIHACMQQLPAVKLSFVHELHNYCLYSSACVWFMSSVVPIQDSQSIWKYM